MSQNFDIDPSQKTGNFLSFFQIIFLDFIKKKERKKGLP